MASIAANITAKQNNRNSDKRVAALASASLERQGNRRPNERRYTERRQDDRRGREERPSMVPDYRTLFKDGMDHINVWNNGKTDLGRMLSMEYEHRISVPVYGKFASVFALWVYLTTKGHSDELRTMPEHMLRAWVKKRRAADMEFSFPYLEFICAQAMVDVIKNNDALRWALIDSDKATLASYIEMREQTVTHPNAKWWLPALNLIRTQLQADLEPDVSALAGDLEDTKLAYIALKKQPMLGQVRMEKPKKQAKPQKERRKGGLAGSYIEDTALKAPEGATVIGLAYATREARADAIAKLLKISAEEFTEKLGHFPRSPVTDGVAGDALVAVSGFDDDCVDLKNSFNLFITVDAQGQMVSLATANFEDPYAEVDGSVAVIGLDQPVNDSIREVMGISSTVPDEAIRHHVVPAPKEAASVVAEALTAPIEATSTEVAA